MYSIGHSLSSRTAQEQLMSGCLQVGSVRALSCYFLWLSLPNVTCTHIHTLHRTVCASMAVSSLLYSFTPCLCHCLSSLSYSLPLSTFPCFKHLFACDLASNKIFGKQFSILSILERKRKREGIQYTSPHKNWEAGTPRLS